MAQKQNKECSDTKVAFRLVGLQTTQFATFKEVYSDQTEIQLRVGFNFGIIKENKIISCLSRIQFSCTEKPLMIIEVRCNFEIEPQAWEEFIEEESNTIVFQKNLLCHLAVLTVGTTRGVLHAKTENTVLNKFFIPTINVTELITDNTSFSLND